MSHRADAEWQAAQAAYVAENGDRSPTQTLFDRLAAIATMYEIETKCKGES